MFKTFKVNENGKFNENGLKFDINNLSRDCKTISLLIYNTNKFQYEKGYTKVVKRAISKNCTIKYDGKIFDLSNVLGLKQHILENR